MRILFDLVYLNIQLNAIKAPTGLLTPSSSFEKLVDFIFRVHSRTNTETLWSLFHICSLSALIFLVRMKFRRDGSTLCLQGGFYAAQFDSA